MATGRDRGDAIDWLANRAGMIPDRPLPSIDKKRTPPQPASAMVMDPIVADYVNACTRVLDSVGGRGVRDWLHRRGLNDDTIHANRVGADPGRDLMRRRRGLPYGAAIAATFPVFDPVGNLTYVQARYLNSEAAGRKYDNPAASVAPHPRLGFTVAPGELRDAPLLVCEGMPDALIAAQEGFQSVGLLGAHTPDDSVGIRLANHLDNLDPERGVVLVTDPDPAGRRLAEALAPMLNDRGHRPVVIAPPDGCDLNAWALREPDWPDILIRQTTTAQRDAVSPTGVGLER